MAVGVTLVGCAGEFSPEKALLKIQKEPEFTTTYSAPIELGRQILTGDHHKNTQKFLKNQYGAIIDTEMVEVKTVEANSWRTVIEFSLSEKGLKLFDKNRTQSHTGQGGEENKDIYYVAVCQLVPEQVLGYTQPSPETAKVTISVVERGITPFGTHLGFTDGRSYEIERTFTKGMFGWNLDPM